MDAGLYLIAQEALANVTRHAGTNEATVRLRLAGVAASLEVEDHGCGFAPEAGSSEQGHLGLAGMAERARELGWVLTIGLSAAPDAHRVAEHATGGAE